MPALEKAANGNIDPARVINVRYLDSFDFDLQVYGER
jgi:hypothetical protein